MEYVCKGGLVRFFLLFFNDFRHMYVEFVDENFFTNLKTSIILVHTAGNSDSAEKSALCNSTVEVLSTEISNHVIRSESFCASL